MPAPLVARVAPPSPVPRPVPPAAPLGEDLGEDGEVDPLDGEPWPDAARAEAEARAIVETIEAHAEALVRAALASGREPLRLVLELRRAAGLIERSYRPRDQRSHHRDGRAPEGGDPASRKARYRVARRLPEEG